MSKERNTNLIVDCIYKYMTELYILTEFCDEELVVINNGNLFILDEEVFEKILKVFIYKKMSIRRIKGVGGTDRLETMIELSSGIEISYWKVIK